MTALILGKPPEKPSGPSHFSILPVVRNCETQSFADMAKMWAFMLNYVWMSTVCCILICDGQAVEMWRNAKRKFPVEYRRVLIGNGGMQSHLSFDFAQLNAIAPDFNLCVVSAVIIQ